MTIEATQLTMTMMTSLWKVMMIDVAGRPSPPPCVLHQLSRGSGRLLVTEMRSLTNWLKACFLHPDEICSFVLGSGFKILSQCASLQPSLCRNVDTYFTALPIAPYSFSVMLLWPNDL